jgi:hypothetical protein
MPTVHRRFGRYAVAAVALTLLAAGCGGAAEPAAVATQQPTTTGPTPTPIPTTTSPTPTPTPTGPGPMTAAERAWLAAAKKMHAKIDAAFSAKEVQITRAKMLSMSTSLGECRRVLRRIGQPTARLGPVRALVNKACGQFDKGAKCFRTAVGVSDASGAVEAGTPAARTFKQALDCGFAGYGDGANTLTDAEAKGEQIKLTAG